MSTNSKAPHKAVCFLQMEVHEILPTGECSGKLVTLQDMRDFGLKPKMIISVSGFDKQDCLKKLKKAIDDFGKTD